MGRGKLPAWARDLFREQKKGKIKIFLLLQKQTLGRKCALGAHFELNFSVGEQNSAPDSSLGEKCLGRGGDVQRRKISSRTEERGEGIKHEGSSWTRDLPWEHGARNSNYAEQFARKRKGPSS